MKSMHTIQHNLDCAQMMVSELETYLLSDELFWYLPEGSAKKPPCPALTLGGLWLILDELRVQESEMNVEERVRYDEIRGVSEQCQTQWAVAWGKKASKELSSRQHLWGSYLVDLDGGKAEPSMYPSEVRNRVVAVYAIRDSGNQPGIQGAEDKMRSLDMKLRAKFQPGSFIWEKPLQEIYPKDEFWFLYGDLKEQSGLPNS